MHEPHSLTHTCAEIDTLIHTRPILVSKEAYATHTLTHSLVSFIRLNSRKSRERVHVRAGARARERERDTHREREREEEREGGRERRRRKVYSKLMQ